MCPPKVMDNTACIVDTDYSQAPLSVLPYPSENLMVYSTHFLKHAWMSRRVIASSCSSCYHQYGHYSNFS